MSGNNNNIGSSAGASNNQNMGPGGGGPPYTPKGINDFKKGDMVWAKVRGYSWWPAKIGDIQRASGEKKFRVDFIGDNTHQTVGQQAIGDFIENFQRNSSTKKRDLLVAIEMARKQLRKDEMAILDRQVGKMISTEVPLTKKPSNNEKMAAGGSNKSIVEVDSIQSIQKVSGMISASSAITSNVGLKQSMVMQQGKPPSCTSKSTNLGNAKTSSEVASELDGTKDSIAFIPIKKGVAQADDKKHTGGSSTTNKQSKGKNSASLEGESQAPSGSSVATQPKKKVNNGVNQSKQLEKELVNNAGTSSSNTLIAQKAA